jgi:uncharacterized protein
MKSKVIWVTGLLVLISLLLVAGCNSGSATPTTPTPAAAAPPVSAVAPAAVSGPVSVNVNGQQGIWVNGVGTVRVTPDIANLNLGVSTQAARVADAQAQAATDMDKVMSALTANGIDKKDISTQFYNISQLTRYDNNTQQSIITGYQVSNTVSVKVRNINNAGAVIDAVAAAGRDSIRINGINFSVDNPGQYYSQARTLAMTDAKAKADHLASLAGVTLGRPVYIAENSSSITPPREVSSGIAQGAPAPMTPISAGQTDITLNLQLVYAIQ